PVGSAGKRNRPSACDTVDCTPINAGEVAVTVTPGKMAPCVSVTSPVRRPCVVCAADAAACKATNTTANTAAPDLIMHPPIEVARVADIVALPDSVRTVFLCFSAQPIRSFGRRRDDRPELTHF